MFKAKEGINIGGKVVTGSGPTAVLTVGDVGTLAYQNAEGATVDNMIVTTKLGMGYGVEAPTYEFDMIYSKPGANLVGRIYNKSTTASTKSILQLATGTTNNTLNIQYQDSVGASIGLGSGAPTLYVSATTHQFRTQVGGNILQIIDGQVTLQNATSNKIKFGAAGVAVPTFNSYSVGVKHVLYDSIGAADAGITIGVSSGSLFNGVRTTADTFTWYGGTTLAATLTGLGALTLVGNLTVSGGSISTGNIAANLLGGNTTTNITIGGALTSGNVTIGTTTTTGTTFIQGVAGLKIPIGTTAQQPVAATAGSGTVRYNSTDHAYEGVIGSSPAWKKFVLGTGSDITTAIGSTAVTNATNATNLTGSQKLTIWIPAAAMTPRTTNGAAPGSVESTTNKIMQKTLDYDTTTQEHAQFMIRMPKSWDVGVLNASFVWTANSTSTAGVVWGIEAVALSDDETIDTAFGTGRVVADTNTATAYQVHLTGNTPDITVGSSPAAECLVVFNVYRAVANASDTLAADAMLLGVNLYYNTTAGITDA